MADFGAAECRGTAGAPGRGKNHAKKPAARKICPKRQKTVPKPKKKEMHASGTALIRRPVLPCALFFTRMNLFYLITERKLHPSKNTKENRRAEKNRLRRGPKRCAAGRLPYSVYHKQGKKYSNFQNSSKNRPTKDAKMCRCNAAEAESVLVRPPYFARLAGEIPRLTVVAFGKACYNKESILTSPLWIEAAFPRLLRGVYGGRICE